MATPIRKKLAILDKLPSFRRKQEAPPPTQARRKVIATESFNPNDEEVKEAVFKPESTKRVLVASLRDHFLFSSLEQNELLTMIDGMVRVDHRPGENIIRQGDEGHELFVLETGKADIIVHGNKVAEYGNGACFGELAMMYNAPRAATILATTDCVLWSLGHRTFRRVLASTSSAKMMSRCEFLKKVPLLQSMTNEQITKVAGLVNEADFDEKVYIIRQGDAGELFYFLQEGRVKCTHRRSDNDPTETDLITLGPGDYFGEMALMLDEPRHANVISSIPIKTLTLNKDQFIELLAPLSDFLSRQMRIRILKSVPLLSDFGDNDLDGIANSMRVQVFEDNDYIIREGDEGSRFYIINEGEVMCTKLDPVTGLERDLMRLSNQEYFGERALIKNEPRKANVKAINGRVECLVLEREEFNGMLTVKRAAMEAEVKRRETIGKQKESENKRGDGGGILLGDGVDDHKDNDVVAGSNGQPSTIRSRRQGKFVSLRQTIGGSVRFEDLRQIRTIGTGTFGRVKLVLHVPSNQVLALKCMQKTQILSSHQERNIMNEKNVLMNCEHPFILELVQTFNSPNQLFMLMEIIQGGELWSYIYEKFDSIPRNAAMGGFEIGTVMFYSACVLSAFNYVHSQGIAYRDLKPENLLLDSRGFLKLIDFGFAKSIPYKKNNVTQTKSFTLCGTPEYLAPELVLSKGHDKAVDYWALGCLIYELIVGRTPFQDDHQPEIFKKIIHSDRSLQFARGFDPLCADLIRRLLTANPAFRLGNLAGGPQDIMRHRWFAVANFSFEALDKMELRSPFVPRIRDPLDTSNFDSYPEDDYVARFTGPQQLFDGF